MGGRGSACGRKIQMGIFSLRHALCVAFGVSALQHFSECLWSLNKSSAFFLHCNFNFLYVFSLVLPYFSKAELRSKINSMAC